jgi:Xaa-Pro aminopeptidase
VKQDLDQLMAERQIDVAMVTGRLVNNPSFYYLANGAHLSHESIVLKRRGHEPVLVHTAMERDEAAKSGLPTLDYNHFDYDRLVKESETILEAKVKLYQRIADEFGLTGQVAFYGMAEQGASYALLTALERNLENATIIGEFENDIFDVARATKGPEEIKRMRRVGEATATVMREVVDHIREHRVERRSENGSESEILVKSDGTPLTIADVKRFARSRLFVYELEDSEGMIFAIGRDAGVPHSRGEEDDAICLGKTIVYDLFPRELGGGYFHDMTRTFCLGYAPPEVQKTYDDVRACFDQVMTALEACAPARRYEELACDIFEGFGHNTHRVSRAVQEGYVHSLGHGVGLKIHERPTFSLVPSNDDVLSPGSVVTVEPGLYYPDRGFGVRIEDTVYLDDAGQFHSLTDFPKELVIEI